VDAKVRLLQAVVLSVQCEGFNIALPRNFLGAHTDDPAHQGECQQIEHGGEKVGIQRVSRDFLHTKQQHAIARTEQ